ncbi:MAG: hypothetical protein AAF721_09135 [Myxococcota bacterium]
MCVAPVELDAPAVLDADNPSPQTRKVTMILATLLSVSAAAGTYLYAKKRRAGTGTAAMAGVATGAGTAVAVSLVVGAWPLLLVLGTPAAAIYYFGKSRGQKSLPPGR